MRIYANYTTKLLRNVNMDSTVVRRQKQMKVASEHCSVPLCSVSSRYNSCVSFHSFPVEEEIRKRWLVNIRRSHFQITKHTKVCSIHFKSDDFVEGTIRRRLKKGAIPTAFEWNRERQMQPPRLSVWERRDRPPTPESSDMGNGHEDIVWHDYCSAPEPAALDLSLEKNDELKREIEDLREKLEQAKINSRFGLQRFAGSDEDIRFYTR